MTPNSIIDDDPSTSGDPVEETEDEHEHSKLVLIFTPEGHAVLEEEDEPVWMSDDDEDFHEVFQHAFLDSEQDKVDVLNWLEENGHIDPEEKPYVEIVQQNAESDEDNEEECQ